MVHMYVLIKEISKLIRGIFIPQYGLRKLKVSRDLEKLVYKVVETPWITPYVNTYQYMPIHEYMIHEF
jgi:hypothetical protein